MAAVATYLPKGHRNGMNSFPRAPRSGSQTWGPGSNQMYNQHSHYTHMSAQAVFYGHPAPMKQEYTNYSGNTTYVANNSAFDSPASSSSPDSSAQGSPRSFEARHSISSQGYDLSPSEEALSNLSSPASEDYSTNSYFPEQFSPDRGIIPLESSAVLPNNPAHAPVVPVQSRDPRASPPQYSSPNRSRQGSTSFLPAVTTERSSLQQKSDDSPVSPTHRAPRGQKPARNARRGGGGGGGQQKDYYTISAPHVLEEVPYTSDDDDFEEPTMVTTLNARVQLAICKEVDEVLRACLFWWLVTYKFDIPRNARARDIETADDRDFEGFCAVVNDLTAKRWVPREAVHHERIAELNTVLAGPSEIRHMLAHPERHLKSDWRMLGLIAAAIEVCKILQYRSGHRQLFNLYKTTEDRICDAKKTERLGAAMADISISKESKPLK